MGFADAVTGRLFATRRRSDLEFQIQSIMERKLAVLDQCNSISSELANTIFQEGQHGDISSQAALLGWLSPNNLVGVPQIGIGGNTYETQLAQLQTLEKELEVKQNKLETELEAVKAEEESLKKIANDHAKKDFKVG